jgi:hypothetical protein
MPANSTTFAPFGGFGGDEFAEFGHPSSASVFRLRTSVARAPVIQALIGYIQ